MKIKPIILAGGIGTRLWPLSRRPYPKQFIAVDGKQSLMQKVIAANRCFGRPTIITTKQYSSIAKRQIKVLNIDVDLIIEPIARNTAICSIISIIHAKESGYDMVMLLPSDHSIDYGQEYFKTINKGLKYASKFGLCTIGITPSFPSTEYGYIKIKEEISKGVYKTEQFTEKPDIKQAQHYLNLNHNQYFWNSGIYICSIEYTIKQYETWQPILLQGAYDALYTAKEKGDNIMPELLYAQVKPVSFDCAITENLLQMIMVTAPFKWHDLGNWPALWHMQTKDKEGNYCKGDVISLDTQNSYITSDGKLTAVIGMDDTIIINTQDALLVVNKSHAEKTKLLIHHMTQIGRKEL